MTGSTDADETVSRLRERPETADTAAVEAGLEAIERGAKGVRRDAAVGVAAVAETDPGPVVPVVDRLARVTTDDAVVRSMVMSALADVAATHPEQLTSSVPALQDRVGDGDPVVRRNALRALARVAAHAPDNVVPAYQVTLEALSDAATHDDATRAHAAVVLRYLADASPEKVAGDVDRLVDVLQTASAEGRSRLPGGPETDEELERERQDVLVQSASTGTALASTLVVLASATPDRLANHVAAIGGALADFDGGIRALLVESFAVLGAQSPAALAGQAETLAAALDDDRTRRHAATALAYLAEVEADQVATAVAPQVESLLACLPTAETDERRAVVSLLAYVAEEKPSAVRPGRRAVADLLADDDAGVRGQALWTLRYVGVDAIDRVRRVESEDPNPDIRALAADVRQDLTD